MLSVFDRFFICTVSSIQLIIFWGMLVLVCFYWLHFQIIIMGTALKLLYKYPKHINNRSFTWFQMVTHYPPGSYLFFFRTYEKAAKKPTSRKLWKYRCTSEQHSDGIPHKDALLGSDTGSQPHAMSWSYHSVWLHKIAEEGKQCKRNQRVSEPSCNCMNVC